MTTVLLAALGRTGAARNLEPLMATLRARGCEVLLMSDPAAAPSAASSGARLIPVEDPRIPSLTQRPTNGLQRIRRMRANMQSVFLDPVPRQWDALQLVLATHDVDVVLADLLMMGASLLGTVPASERPAVGVLGMLPLTAPDPEVATYGAGVAPLPGEVVRIRNAVLDRFVAGPALAGIESGFRSLAKHTTGYDFSGSVWGVASRADVWCQASVPRFDYLRSSTPANLRWVGPLAAVEQPTVPDWWDPRSEPPVVVVHAGARAALEDLVIPTIEAQRGVPSITIVCGASRDDLAAAYPEGLPPDVHFESSIPWSRLVPRQTVFVGPGDYMQVQLALRHGVPVVVNGASDGQIETTARVAWLGAGVRMPGDRPTPRTVRNAIARVRADPGIHFSVAKIAAQMGRTNAERTISDIVDQLAGDRSGRRPVRVSGD